MKIVTLPPPPPWLFRQRRVQRDFAVQQLADRAILFRLAGDIGELLGAQPRHAAGQRQRRSGDGEAAVLLIQRDDALRIQRAVLIACAGQTEAGLSQGFTPVQIMVYIIMPQAIRKMLPAIISQIVTVIKDTSFLYSVIALQELFGSSQILMGRYFEAEQVFALYLMVALIYFVINFAISSLSRYVAKSWASSIE